ncbi:hypothetical protein Patl1_02999 [Pistacia atlantica]|uniref:Uncharacterized protein n=1 Tax=Pistacia atlantica TaxID=434234 RepID=A0ACC1C6T2_9ROSI|nr:hypothetical protein Patl1_02999 [Pistacia atlantica]
MVLATFRLCSFKRKTKPHKLRTMLSELPTHTIVTSYARLMYNLIDTDEDVEILSENDIIDNWLNPEDTKQFFNKLYHDRYVKEFFYHDICHKVNKHRKRWCNS